MQGILAQLIVLFIALCALSVMVSPLFGRGLDPFFLTRPFTRWGMRLPARFCRGMSRGFNRLYGASWREAMRTRSLLLKLVLFPTSAVCAATALAFAIPAEILGEIRR